MNGLSRNALLIKRCLEGGMQDIVIEVMHMEIKAQELDRSPLIITGNS